MKDLMITEAWVTLILNQIPCRGMAGNVRDTTKNLDTNLPEACSVCHMIT